MIQGFIQAILCPVDRSRRRYKKLDLLVYLHWTCIQNKFISLILFISSILSYLFVLQM